MLIFQLAKGRNIAAKTLKVTDKFHISFES